MVAGLFQSDALAKWLAEAGRGTETISSDTVLAEGTEYANVDTTLNTVKATLTDTSVAGVEITREIIISDTGGNAGTNSIQIVPDPTDGTTIEGLTELFIEEDGGVITLKLANSTTWVVIANANRFSRAIGGFTMTGNATATTIITAGVFEDIAGTAAASPINNKFDFSASPNELTYIGSADITVLGTVTVGARRDSGAAVRLTSYAVFKDTGSGFVVIPGPIGTLDVTNQVRSTSFPMATTLSTGDVIKVMLTNEADLSAILAVDLSLIMSETGS